MIPTEIAGQLNAAERQIITAAILNVPRKPAVVLEVGTWLGGGSTLHILRALEKNNEGHLWGIEADRSIYDRMIANLRSAAPGTLDRFTPLFGFSTNVIPKWLQGLNPGEQVDLVFLDGGDNPLEQVTEFQLLDDRIPIGGQLFAHDAKLRKGKWLGPYVRALDNWVSELHDVSSEGLFASRKIALHPSADSLSRARKLLWRMRLNIVELCGALLPASVVSVMLRFLPSRTVRALTQGRK